MKYYVEVKTGFFDIIEVDAPNESEAKHKALDKFYTKWEQKPTDEFLEKCEEEIANIKPDAIFMVTFFDENGKDLYFHEHIVAIDRKEALDKAEELFKEDSPIEFESYTKVEIERISMRIY